MKKPRIVFEDQFFISTDMTPEETEEMLRQIAHRAMKDLPEKDSK